MPPADYEGLRVRKLADTSDGERVVRWHPVTGEKMLLRPATVAADDFDYETMRPEPWPLAGLVFDHDEPPKRTVVSTSFVNAGKQEGWLEVVNEQAVHRPGGPPENLWQKTHTFLHADAIVFKTVDGEVRYRVTHQPDKYVEGGPDSAKVTNEKYAAGETRVDHFYELALEG